MKRLFNEIGKLVDSFTDEMDIVTTKGYVLACVIGTLLLPGFLLAGILMEFDTRWANAGSKLRGE